MAEVETLRRLSAITFDWVKFEYERIATEIVQAHNALPMSERPSSGGFAINIGPPHDHFAPITKQKTLKK